MTNYRQTMSQTLELMRIINELKILERTLTDTEKKRREEIAQDMDDSDFKSRYGDRWKEVKMAVATKQAKKEDIDDEDKESSGDPDDQYDDDEERQQTEKITRDQTYFKTYSDAVSHALEYTRARGYEVDEDDFHNKVTTGPRKPSEGKTVSQRIDVTKDGKPVKKFSLYER